MTIKERFTVAVSVNSDRKEVRGIYDHKTNKQITQNEFERICNAEYGEYLEAKNKVIQKTLELILAEMDLYNLTCEKGFEITIDDVINNFKNVNKCKNVLVY